MTRAAASTTASERLWRPLSRAFDRFSAHMAEVDRIDLVAVLLLITVLL